MLIKGIELYNPDTSIPYFNYQRLQRFLVLGAGIGNTTDDVLSRLSNIQTYAANERPEDVITEVDNFMLAIYSALEGLSYDTMAFACMVKSIDGVVVDIATDNGVKLVSEQILAKGVTEADVSEYLALLKKKLMRN